MSVPETQLRGLAEYVARPRATRHRHRRCEIRKEVALRFVLALKEHGPLHLAAVARTIDVRPGGGTIRNVRDDLIACGAIHARRGMVRNARNDLIEDDIYLLPGQRPPEDREAAALEAVDWTARVPDSAPTALRPDLCRCEGHVLGADTCWKCGRSLAVAA